MTLAVREDAATGLERYRSKRNDQSDEADD